MGQDKVKELFFENPSKQFYLRQIAKLTKVPKSTVARILNQLLSDSIIVREKSEPFDKYRANTEDSLYKFHKKQFMLEKIYQSGLIDYIVEDAHPKTVILFGSCAKGEYDEKSDIDIFIESSETGMNFDKFKLKHAINPYFAKNIMEISKELRQNIINGSILHGMLKIWQK